jgi:hypothetical protein
MRTADVGLFHHSIGYACHFINKESKQECLYNISSVIICHLPLATCHLQELRGMEFELRGVGVFKNIFIY